MTPRCDLSMLGAIVGIYIIQCTYNFTELIKLRVTGRDKNRRYKNIFLELSQIPQSTLVDSYETSIIFRHQK